MEEKEIAALIEAGDASLGLELGSTRIKAVLVAPTSETIAVGNYGWENERQDGIWTYALSAVWEGIAACYLDLAQNVTERYGVKLRKIGAMGISAMMHGYLPFDKDGKQLVPFRTWRNTITGEAADHLTEAFHFNIPQRWSIAHLDQALLKGEPHVKDIAFLTTLAGYVHWRLTGEKVLGIGDASGMFPVDEAAGTYDAALLARFSELPEVQGMPWRLEGLLPRVLRAGAPAGTLTAEGARLLDPTGTLEPGALFAPPEGDAGTGMVSTNAVRKRTGNVSIGTSAFSMHVLDAPLREVHRDIDLVTTPVGAPVAMVHTNNCSSEINVWAGLFSEVARCFGEEVPADRLYEALFQKTEEAQPDAGGLVTYNCLSGEPVTQVAEGRPLFLRTPHSQMNLANFMLAQLYAAFAPLRIGLDVLTQEEHIAVDSLVAQGGLFRTPKIAQQILANMLDLPVTVMQTASEGGAWGMAVLALYARADEGLSLADYLDQKVFASAKKTTLAPVPEGAKGAAKFLAGYRQALPVERAAAVLAEAE